MNYSWQAAGYLRELFFIHQKRRGTDPKEIRIKLEFGTNN